jgi:16S rRNA (guanine527-N7)-methyltransferase
MSVGERLGELAERYALAAGAPARLAALLELLASDPRAPTSVTHPARAVDSHVADALSALELPAVRAAKRIADVGSGAGLPGLVLAIALPAGHVWLVESSHRKCEFLERARAATATANATVVCARAEDWPAGIARHDVVTARALGPLALLCEYAAPLLALGGLLVAWKGGVARAEIEAAERAAGELGLEPLAMIRAEPYAGSTSHQLHLYRKSAATPSRFPRRPGAARKRPLGARP